MKNLLFIIPALILSHLTHAQYQYVPIPTNNISWKGTNSIVDGTNKHHCYKLQYSLQGVDSVKGADTFHMVKVIRYSEHFRTGCNLDNAFDAPTIYGYLDTAWMIEKNKRVYVLDSLVLDTTIHWPSLDFNMSVVGQSYQAPKSDSVIVMSIDTVNIHGSLRKRIIARNTLTPVVPQYDVIDTMIEGLGSIRFGLGFANLIDESVNFSREGRIHCISVNSQVEYRYNNSNCADIWLTGIDDQQLGTDIIKIAPNPFNDILKISNIESNTLTVYNTLGRVIYSTNSNSKHMTIDTHSWPPGLYVLKVDGGTTNNNIRLVKY